MAKRKSLARGILAGMAGGLAAAWVMNDFMTGLGQKLQSAQTEQVDPRPEASEAQSQDDATMKAADAVAYSATGDHFSLAQKEKSGPLVHYAFGALTGAIYGGLAEYSPTVKSGFGTGFGGVLFSTADLLAVPALKLTPSPAGQPPSAQASPFAAHIVYGVTTELVRRTLRALF